MEKINKKLIAGAVMSVIAAFASLTVASFAWFSSSLTVTVSNLTLNVSSSEALMVSVDGEDFGTKVTETELWNVKNAFGYTNIVSRINGGSDFNSSITRSLSPATPALVTNQTIGLQQGELNFLRLKSGISLNENRDYSADNIYDSVGSVSEVYDNQIVNYMRFDLYLKANFAYVRNGYNIVLDLSSTDESGEYSGTTVKPVNTNGKNHIVKSVRYGFVCNQNNDTTVKVFEPDTSAANDIPVANYDTSKLYNADIAFDNSVVTSGASQANQGNLVLFEGIETVAVYKMTVYIWLEGNDSQNNNEASASAFKSELKLSLVLNQ